MNPLRVLHVVHSLAQGGMENGVCNLATGLQSSGIESHVACLERAGELAMRLPCSSTLQLLGKKGGFSLRAVFALWQLIRRLRPHVLHTHNLGPLIYASLATLGGRLCPIVHGEHASLAPWELEPRRIAQRRRLYRACRAIHTVSPAQLAELRETCLGSASLSAIANGVDTKRFQPAEKKHARQQIGLPADALIIGMVARFGPYKRHDLLLEAFHALGQEFSHLHLLLVGAGGSEEMRIHAMAAAHPYGSRIKLAGFQAEPAPYYQAMDLLAIPSQNEGMSNAALEAMACGVPVLGNTGCGHEALLTPGQEGQIAALVDAATFTAELRTMLQNLPRLVDMGRAARITVEKRFSLAAMFTAYEQLYRAHARRS